MSKHAGLDGHRPYPAAWRRVTWRLAALVLLLAATVAGCGGPAAEKAKTPPPSEPLAAMLQAYQQAKTYADAAVLRFEVLQGTQKVGELEPAPFSMAMERPNRLRVEAFKASVMCDGQRFIATLSDKHYSGQILYLDAPPTLTSKDLAADPVLEEAMADDMGLRMPQLDLLLAQTPLENLFGDDFSTRRLPDATIEQEKEKFNCRVVQLTTKSGDFTLWIDPQSQVLRRMELPGAPFAEKLGLKEGYQFRVLADFVGARLNEKVPAEAFKFEPPATANLVKHFVTPPAELSHPPSKLVGEQPGAFKFTGVDGATISGASLAGKPVVLDFWSVTCQPCFMSFPNVQKVYDRYGDKVTFVAVNLDELSVNDQTVAGTFRQAKLTLPIARDPEHAAEEAFAIRAFPTMILLGADGSVQDYEIGYHPNLLDILPGKLDKLLAGEDLARDAWLRFDHAKQAFQRQLAAAAAADVEQQIELPQATVKERTDPERIKIEKTWTAEGIKNPGNLLVVPDEAGGVRIMVLDGWKSVVELDSAGKQIARHELEMPSASLVTLLRTGVGQDGKRFYVGFNSSQPQVHLFDQDWKFVLSYPSEAAKGGISDVQMADLNGDGQLEMNVSYFGPVGIQCVSLDGTRIWANRALENIYSLTAVETGVDNRRALLCTNEREAIGVIDSDGKSLPDIAVPDKAVEVVVAANLDSDPPAELVAVTATDPVSFAVTGLDFQGQSLWSYPLPLGARKTPCELLTPGRVLAEGPGQWLLTGADGSIHIIAADGQLLDRFNYGEELAGIGSAVVDGQGLLLVASTRELAAWRVVVPQE